VVTGADKGIGLAIVRQLAKEGITVVLTARDATRGKEALESLKSQGLHNVNFHPLDVASQESILALAEWLHKTYGGIDILVSTFANCSIHRFSVITHNSLSTISIAKGICM
jgi:NAD(P)-dependent dehydrogenase (short-subunit alcohol dehydrogenase family)